MALTLTAPVSIDDASLRPLNTACITIAVNQAAERDARMIATATHHPCWRALPQAPPGAQSAQRRCLMMLSRTFCCSPRSWALS
jgi:hypothetical protein